MPHESLAYQPNDTSCWSVSLSTQRPRPFLTSQPIDGTWPGLKVITGQFESVQTGAISQKSSFAKQAIGCY